MLCPRPFTLAPPSRADQTGGPRPPMPTYEYQCANPDAACDQCRAPFEVQQPITEAALTACPHCGGAIKRLISLCSVSTAQSAKSMLSDKNLKAKGFTKLVNEGGGKFRKTT